MIREFFLSRGRNGLQFRFPRVSLAMYLLATRWPRIRYRFSPASFCVATRSRPPREKNAAMANAWVKPGWLLGMKVGFLAILSSPEREEVDMNRGEGKVTRRAEEKRRSGPPPISIASLVISSIRSLVRSFVFFFLLYSPGRFVPKASRLVRARCLPARSWLCKRWFDWFVPMHHPFGLVKPDRLASGEGGLRVDATGDLSCSCYGQLVP